MPDDEEEIDQDFADEGSFGKWLQSEMAKQNIGIQDLADKTGLTYVGIWNIVRGNTKWPREATRKRISNALNSQVPFEVETDITTQSSVSGYTWTDFSPYDLQTIPELGGIYVFYDITDRPVYVGKSNSNVRGRVQDHQTRFWFKQPLVMRGSFLAVSDQEMCDKIEMILIKFLGNHALLNFKGVRRDVTN
jgi:transcriptional regulator with XRE-family HTH domain